VGADDARRVRRTAGFHLHFAGPLGEELEDETAEAWRLEVIRLLDDLPERPARRDITQVPGVDERTPLVAISWRLAGT
jgi:hypothetical protein